MRWASVSNAAGVSLAIAVSAVVTWRTRPEPVEDLPRPVAGGFVVEPSGLAMHYEAFGAAPRTMLVLHGGGGSLSDLARLIARFSRGWRVIAPEQRAHGRTSDDGAPLTYDAMADDTAALMDALGVARADCFGWSDGGIVCLDLAMRYPARIAHVAASGANASPAGLTDDARGWMEAADPAEDDRLRTLWLTLPQWTDADLGKIRAPTLLIAGETDMIRAEHTEQMARAIPRGESLVVPGATHAVPIEKPDVVAGAVERAFARPL